LLERRKRAVLKLLSKKIDLHFQGKNFLLREEPVFSKGGNHLVKRSRCASGQERKGEGHFSHHKKKKRMTGFTNAEKVWQRTFRKGKKKFRSGMQGERGPNPEGGKEKDRHQRRNLLKKGVMPG